MALERSVSSSVNQSSGNTYLFANVMELIVDHDQQNKKHFRSTYVIDDED
jgi:hypothetical protein